MTCKFSTTGKKGQFDPNTKRKKKEDTLIEVGFELGGVRIEKIEIHEIVEPSLRSDGIVKQSCERSPDMELVEQQVEMHNHLHRGHQANLAYEGQSHTACEPVSADLRNTSVPVSNITRHS